MSNSEIISITLGLVGLIFAIVQQIRLVKINDMFLRRYWNTTKKAHKLMWEIEKVKSAAEKCEDKSPVLFDAIGTAHSSSASLVETTLENVFHVKSKYTQDEINHMKRTKLLEGYLLFVFEQMLLKEP